MEQKDEMLLLRLRDCATSSRIGLVDKGFPADMKLLAAQGYVTAKDGGHVVTPAGIEYLRENRQLLKRI